MIDFDIAILLLMGAAAIVFAFMDEREKRKY
jgi:hypothetical protein